MFVPYMTLPDYLEIVHSIKAAETDPIIVHCEQPDEHDFKVAEINLDNMSVISRVGFTEPEMDFLLGFCRNNRESIIKYEKIGGVYNA
ncbi:MAG: hypothetical protein IJT87_11635 [Ruminiclostridium sp.]|nr:hypothetical protein [Ruminiclostridium sp.]